MDLANSYFAFQRHLFTSEQLTCVRRVPIQAVRFCYYDNLSSSVRCARPATVLSERAVKVWEVEKPSDVLDSVSSPNGKEERRLRSKPLAASL